MTLSEEVLEDLVSFHGHMCPGLAMGVKAAELAIEQVGRSTSDESIVAVTETDMCAVDAIQALVGCTFGTGSLVHNDVGKTAFTFVRRSDQKAVRVSARADAWGSFDPEHQSLFAKVRSGEATEVEKTRFQELHLARSKAILAEPAESLFDVKSVSPDTPPKARIHQSIECVDCGERVMETRIRHFGGEQLCIPCFDAKEKG